MSDNNSYSNSSPFNLFGLGSSILSSFVDWITLTQTQFLSASVKKIEREEGDLWSSVFFLSLARLFWNQIWILSSVSNVALLSCKRSSIWGYFVLLYAFSSISCCFLVRLRLLLFSTFSFVCGLYSSCSPGHSWIIII